MARLRTRKSKSGSKSRGGSRKRGGSRRGNSKGRKNPSSGNGGGSRGADTSFNFGANAF